MQGSTRGYGSRDSGPRDYVPRDYGLTTAEAVRAFTEGHPESLPPTNRWRFAIEDHAAGQHDGRPATFARICPVCARMAVHVP